MSSTNSHNGRCSVDPLSQPQAEEEEEEGEEGKNESEEKVKNIGTEEGPKSGSNNKNDNNNNNNPTDHTSMDNPVDIPSSLPSFLQNAIFYLLGIGLLVPWNAFISAKPYLQQRSCPYDSNMESWLGFLYNSASVATLITMILSRLLILRFYPSQHQSLKSQPSYSTVMVPLFLYFATFLLMSLLVFWNDIPPKLFVALTLTSLALCGSMGALATVGIVATAGSVSVGALFAGQAVGGVFVSFANLGASWSQGQRAAQQFQQLYCHHHDDDAHLINNNSLITPPVLLLSEQHDNDATTCLPYDNTSWSTFLYFFIGCLLLLACLVGYHVIVTSASPSEQQQQQYEPVQDVEDLLSVHESPRIVADPRVGSGNYSGMVSPNKNSNHNSSGDGDINDTSIIDRSEVDDNDDDDNNYQSPSTLSVLSEIKAPAFAIYGTFVVTLMIFPAWTSTLCSTRRCDDASHRIDNDLYTPLTFVWFNIGDLLGRWIAEWWHRASRIQSKWLILGTLLRALFIVLFASLPSDSHAASSAPSSPLSLFLHSDWVSWCVQLGFAVSNGILISASFLTAPELTRDGKQSSELLNLAVGSGLLSGSALSFGYSAWATGK